MGYFDNLDNGLLNKYKKNLKIEKSLWLCSFFFLWIDVHSISLSFGSPSKTVKLKPLQIT
jgi:hypothetical protein